MRKKIIMFSALILLQVCLPVVTDSLGFAQTTPAEGGFFPDLSLPLPQKVEEKNYLAMEAGPFRLSQIPAEVLIVEIFNMYCPHCQREAPNINKLFEALSGRSDLQTRVKLLGIGVGNSPFEVNAFRNLYRVEFPLLPDGDFSIHKLLGEVGTPYFFVLRNRPAPGRLEVIYSRVGSIGHPIAFLDMIAARLDSEKKK